MFKRVGVFAFILTAGALFQPLTASAEDRFDHGRDRFDRGRDRVVEVHRDQPRFTQEYVVPAYVQPVYRDNWNSDRLVREDHDRFVDRDGRRGFQNDRDRR